MLVPQLFGCRLRRVRERLLTQVAAQHQFLISAQVRARARGGDLAVREHVAPVGHGQGEIHVLFDEQRASPQ
jgi:hypothetical protein